MWFGKHFYFETWIANFLDDSVMIDRKVYCVKVSSSDVNLLMEILGWCYLACMVILNV